MKKLFSVLAIAALVSCNSDETKTDDVKPVESTTVAPTATDVAPAVVDTLKKVVDTVATAK